MLFIVYMPPDADESGAADVEDRIIIGYFSHCNFQARIPTYEQTVKCSMRGNATLDKMCNVKSSYHVFKRPPMGNGDHSMLFCVSAYVRVNSYFKFCLDMLVLTRCLKLKTLLNEKRRLMRSGNRIQQKPAQKHIKK